jgi:hypothetical protein
MGLAFFVKIFFNSKGHKASNRGHKIPIFYTLCWAYSFISCCLSKRYYFQENSIF